MLKKSKDSNLLVTITADLPTPMINVHFVSNDEKVESQKQIPIDILLQYKYYVKKKKGIFTVEDEDGKYTDSKESFHNKYFVNAKDKDQIIKDSKLVELEIKDGMKRVGFQRYVNTKEKYDREFIKVINPLTAEYITVYSSDLEGKVLTKQTFRATINQDPSHPSNRRSVEVNNETFNQLYAELNEKANFKKLHDGATKKSIVLGRDKHSKHNSSFSDSVLKLKTLTGSSFDNSVSNSSTRETHNAKSTLPLINSKPKQQETQSQNKNLSTIPKLPPLNRR